MLKQTIRDILIHRQQRLYRDRIRKRHIYFHDWEMDWEKIRPDFHAETKAAVIRYGKIRETLCNVRRIEDIGTEIVIFTADKGRLTRYAGDYIAEYFNRHPEIRLLYGDEDQLDEEGLPQNPYFKPDWSPDSYRSAFYIGSIFAVRANLLMEVLREGHGQFPEGACAGDFLFDQLARRAGGYQVRQGMNFRIGHVNEILFHGAQSQDLFCGRFFSDHIHRLDSTVSVSIIIPSKDHPDILTQCIQSILVHDTGDTQHISYEILIIDNGSSEENRRKISAMADNTPHEGGLRAVRYIYRQMPFNFSRMCNIGAKMADGEYFLFLNDDIEVIQNGWLRELTAQAVLPWAGAVGAKLLYPETDLIQHAGITNVRLGPMHKLQKMHDEETHYFGFNRGIHDLIGVTGACLMVNSARFEEAGGYREDLAVAFNDVDLCYALIEKGYYNICCNHIRLYHHESLSRGNDTEDVQKMERLAREYDILMGRHEELYHVDPFYHKYLTDDEHVADFLRTEDDDLQVQRLACAKFRTRRSGYPPQWTDECLRIGVEYANTMSRWIRNYQLAADGVADGYFIKGYSFVIGSDNAFYTRRLLLRKVEGEPGDSVPVGKEVLDTSVYDCYREDIRDNLEGQIHVDLTGFRVRIETDTLSAGKYQVGMLFADQTSRQRIVNWAPNLLLIGAEQDTEQTE